MQPRQLGRTGLSVMPIVFGGNVFGWTIDEEQSFRILDRFVDLGFNAIDTANVYSAWVDGHSGGESESIIGRWLSRDRSKRDKVVIVTKVGMEMGDGSKGLAPDYIAGSADASLKRLGIDAIDLYLAHAPDDSVPVEDSLGAFARLKEAGKVRAIGCSNYDATQLQDALDKAAKHGLPRFDVLQPEYNLYGRESFEGPLRDLCIREDIGVISYFALAAGFLSGKYRSKDDLSKSMRGSRVEKYLNDRGMAVLAALDEVSARHGAQPAEVAVAWLLRKDGLTAPIASATSLEQLDSLAKSASLNLSTDDMDRLDRAGA